MIDNKPIMDEEDLIAEKQSVINKLLNAIRKHRNDCPDHDMRVLDQILWSVVDIHEMLSNDTPTKDTVSTT
jgi:hypothetical protein